MHGITLGIDGHPYQLFGIEIGRHPHAYELHTGVARSYVRR